LSAPAENAQRDAAQVQPFVCGIDGLYSLYVVSENGITKLVGTSLESIIVLVALFSLAFVLGNAFHIGYLALTLLFVVVALPIIEALNLRRVARLVRLPPLELITRAMPADSIPWDRVRKITCTNDTFRISDPRFVFTALDHDLAERTLEVTKMMRPTELLPEKKRLRTRVAYWLADGPAVFLLLFAFETFILIAAAVLPFFPGEQAQYATVLESTRNQLSGATPPQEFLFIFLNNVQVALGDGILFIGQIALAITTYNTGRVIQVIAIQDSISVYTILETLYLLPHTWVETLSYSVASGVFIQYVLKKLHPELTSAITVRFQSWRSRPDLQFSISYAKVAGMLFVAGILEVSEPFLGAGALVLWIPVFGFAIWYLRRQTARSIR